MIEQGAKTQKPVFKITIGFVLGWAWAIIFGLAGLSSLLTQDAIIGVLALLSALIALPPFAELLRNRTRIVLSGWLRVALAIGLMFAIGARYQQIVPHSAAHESEISDPVADVTSVSAIELAQAFQANEVSAQAKYGGKTLEVSGTVAGVMLDLFDNPVVHLAGANEFLPVQAKFGDDAKQQLANLSKGQQVVVRCSSLTSVISTPVLSDCTLTPKLERQGSATQDTSAPPPQPSANPTDGPDAQTSSPPNGASSDNTGVANSGTDQPKSKEAVAPAEDAGVIAVFSTPESARYSPAFRKCLDGDGVPNDVTAIANCADAELAVQVHGLKEIDRKIMSPMNARDRQTFDDNERGWMQTVEPQCAPPDPNDEYAPMKKSMCEVRLVARRTMQVQKH